MERLSKLKDENAQVVGVKKGDAHNANVISSKLKRKTTQTETAISNMSQNIRDETKFGVQSVAISQMSTDEVHTFT